ncbi:PAS domain-containing protein [Rhodopila globiformis]|uniref:PAS domain-containing protein n=1 Tax=Rhodopila globiformis TaxID=1071 RepID=UPI0013049243|nr:PAS domain-containing protein [Rhodopila globiformis]
MLDLRTWALSGSVLFSDKFRDDRATPFDPRELEAAIHPDDRNRWRTAFELAVTTGAELDLDYRLYRPDGTLVWLHVRGQVTCDLDGVPLRMTGVSLDVTERRASDLRLELSEESLRLATEAAEIGSWDLDLDTGELTWSDRTRAMFGIFSGGPVSMADFYAGLHPDDREATGAAFASSMDPAVRATYDVEYRTIGKEDGVVRWVAAKGKGLFQDGRCRRAIGTAIDITARKLAANRQAFLLDLWDRLRAHSQPDAIVAAAAEALGRHLKANRVGYGQVLADDETIALETYFVDSVAPVTGAFPLAAFGAAAVARQRQGLTIADDDLPPYLADGPQAYVPADTRSFASVPLVRDGRFIACLFVSYRDPHPWHPDEIALVEDVAARLWDAWQRARAEAALRQANDTLEKLIAERTAALQASEARLRTIFETSYQLQGLIALDGTLLEANATLLAAIGATPGDVIGRPFWQTPWFTGTPGMADTIRAAVAAASRGETMRREITLQLPSGRRSFDFSIRPVRDENGTIVAFVPEAADVTERRETEEALRQSQKMEAIGQLTGGIAHDFNNLLASIMGSLELASQRIGAGRAAESERFLTIGMTAARRAAALTQRLLAFARRQSLAPARVDGNRLVESMEDLLRRTLGPAVDLRMNLGSGLWPVLCDPNQLENALLNLAINARDAMPDGGRLTIETANAILDDIYARSHADEIRPGAYVAITVTDTGTGMEPDVMARAFEPFFTTKPTGQGTGLGLSMLYGFVKQSEGHVTITSRPGQGTSFTVYLPRYDGAADPQADDGADDAALASRAGDGSVVLIVDDEASLRMLVAERLHELGHAVIEAADGPSALRLLQSNMRVDLLLTDVGLPGLNGRQVADAARAQRPGLPVLFMTGYAHASAGGNRLLEPGMELITKPFALEALLARVQRMLGAPGDAAGASETGRPA